MLGTIVNLLCWVWAIEVVAVLLLYAWALCNGAAHLKLTDIRY